MGCVRAVRTGPWCGGCGLRQCGQRGSGVGGEKAAARRHAVAAHAVRAKQRRGWALTPQRTSCLFAPGFQCGVSLRSGL